MVGSFRRGGEWYYDFAGKMLVCCERCVKNRPKQRSHRPELVLHQWLSEHIKTALTALDRVRRQTQSSRNAQLHVTDTGISVTK